MELSSDDVKKISELCRIELSEAEVLKYQKELTIVLDYVSELQTVSTEGVLEISQVTGLENIIRSDVSVISPLREKIIENFPDSKDSFLKIKSIL